MSKKIDTSVVNNLIGHNFGRGSYIAKEDLINMVDVAGRYIKATVLPNIKEMQKIIASEDNKRRIISSISYSQLGFRDDIELLDTLYKIANDFVKSTSDIKSKIEEVVPDYLSTRTSNINHKLLLSLVGLGIFFADNLPRVLSYWITKYYLEDQRLDTYKNVVGYSISLANIIKNLRKLKIKDILNAVGKFPTIRAEKNEVPSQIVLGFAKKNLGITNKFALSFIGQALNLLKKDTRVKANRKNQQSKALIGASGFIGNPIYHIRLFLTDLEINKYKSLEDEKRLLELKLAELKAKQQGTDDPKLKQQIEFYENEIKKTEDKINVILKDVNLNRKNQ